MKLPILYKKTTVGKTQSWEIEVDGNRFRTTSGQHDGAKIINNWTECAGKNEGRANATTGEEQALKEAQAKHQKKLDKGYYEDVAAIDKDKFFKPMLAQDFKNKNRHQEVMDALGNVTVISQPKLDGVRCIATKDGLATRTGKPITAVPHISEALVDFFAKYPDAVLDGELYNHELKDDFNALIHLIRKQNLSPEHLKESKEMIQYHIYDVPVTGLQKKALACDRFVDRFSILEPYTSIGGHSERYHNGIRSVYTEIVETPEQLDKKFEDYLLLGYEGQMIRFNVPYENKRSSKLLKRKEFIDGEYTILGYEEGRGNRAGTVKHFKFETEAGRPFTSNVKGTHAYLKDLLGVAAAQVGKRATIKYFQLTPDGVPRFPYVMGIRDYE